MSKLSRRRFVSTSLAGLSASALPVFTRPASAATVTRSNLATPAGQAMLKKYAAAVKAMVALPASNPLSWTFQWFTHAVPNNTTKAAQLTAIYGPNPSPQKTLATQMWNTCAGHFSATDEPYFLVWHRMYVCFFEEICRKVLNDNTFALPYWNYTAPAGFAIPKEFRMQNDPVFGPLFRPNRKTVVNQGQPIFNGNPGGTASDLSPNSALMQSGFLPNGVVSGFNQTIDLGLHGNVHVFVGNSQGMGKIPWAANDPIFWMHHCNIDRIWASWNNSGHANPQTASWLNKTFVFANTAGQAVAPAPLAKNFTDTVKCGYKYDQLLSSPILVAAAPALAAPVAVPPVTVAKSAGGPIALGAAPARVSVPTDLPAPAAPSPGAPAPASPLSGRLSTLPEQRRLYLVIGNIRADDQPEAIYRVYLDLPDGAPPSDPVNSNYVGSFNFFAAVPHGDGGHADHVYRSVSFDITNLAANLDAKGLLKAEHTVTIVPSNEPAANAKPVVGDISFVEQ